MKPGRELDAIIAEKIMGWTEIEMVKQTHTGLIQPQGVRHGTAPAPHTGYKSKFVIPEYSTDIKAAWEVVEAIESVSHYGSFRILHNWDGKWDVGWEWKDMGSSSVDHQAIEATAPHAICLAALKTINFKFDIL